MGRDKEQSQPFTRWFILTFVFLLALLPRAVYPVSRPMQWFSRSVRFSDALLARDWAATYQRYHPGVTTMWLSGVGMKIFAWRKGLSSEQLLGAAPAKPGVLNDAVTAGVLPLAFVIALCIGLSYLLLSKIAGSRVAFAGSCLIALDPFYITHSKVLHVDALLATFMLTSVLFLLTYLRRSKCADLMLSGVFAGLAFLSKSPAYFLVPYSVLMVGVHELVLEAGSGWREWGRRFLATAWILLLWGTIACVVFAALWPAMWVDPLDSLRQVGSRIVFHIGTAHYNPVFFNGEVTDADPGPLFYLATVAWKTTLVTLPMLCAGVVLTAVQLRRGKREPVAWWLTAYAVFFTAQMCLGARKELAYLLPVFPALDIMAGLGVVHIADAVAQAPLRQRLHWLPSALILGVLVLQAVLVLPRHPY